MPYPSAAPALARSRMLWLQLFLLLALLTLVIARAAAQATPAPEPTRDLDAEAEAIARATPVDSLGVPVELARLDWANLSRFAEANREVPPRASGEHRVVFMGNSITEGWDAAYPELFARHPTWHNRGIGGQTTEQMLVRFRADVIDLHPDLVVLAAGINDIAANTGYTPPEETLGHLKSMCELAAANDIEVLLASILPAYAFVWRPTMASPAQKVVALNAMLEAYAKTRNDVTYLDLFSVLVDERPGIKEGLSTDEVHLTRAGYEAIAPRVEAAVAGQRQ